MDKTDKNEYDVQAAAAILGIEEEKLKQMISRGEVEARDENGAKWVSKATIAKLFDKVSNDQDDPAKATVIEKTPATKRISKIPKKTRLPKGAISLEEEFIAKDDPRPTRKPRSMRPRKSSLSFIGAKKRSISGSGTCSATSKS